EPTDVDSLLIKPAGTHHEAPQTFSRRAQFARGVDLVSKEIKAALPSIDEKDRNNPAVYPPGEVLKKCEFSEAFDGKQLQLREKIWEIVKAH
ncbi:MAG: hypothetical protein GY850_19185, partial [bacterium]|nr:hypothetical protein [bacterium]